MASGGYRKPTSPAPVSGPGRLAQRTDGGPGQKLMAPTGMAYGDNTGLLDQERGAAMSQANPISGINVPNAPSAPAPGAASRGPMVPFGAGTQRPGEPVTSGVDIGAGPGSEAITQPPPQMSPQAQGPMSQSIASMAPGSMTGAMADLYQAASMRGV